MSDTAHNVPDQSLPGELHGQGMAGTYSFIIDKRQDFVLMTLGGFFAVEEIAAFDRARRVAYRQLRCEPNQHLTLIDMRTTAIQSQEAVDAFKRSIEDPSTKSRRIAFVVSKSLARLQVQRAASKADAAYFTTLEEAKIWLLGPVELAA